WRLESGSVVCGSWRRPARRWWPLPSRSRPSAMWRSPATSCVGYRPSGITDRLLGLGPNEATACVEQLVDRCFVRHRPYLRRLRLRLLHRHVLEGSVVMQLKGGQQVTLTPGQTSCRDIAEVIQQSCCYAVSRSQRLIC